MKGKLVSVLPLFFVVLASAVPAPAQQTGSNPTVIPPVSYDISPPLVDLVASAPPKAPTSQRNIPLRQLARPTPAPPASVIQDQALQQLSLPLVSTSPGLDFDGIGADGVAPPDTNGSVGATQFVQIVNVEYAVYNKTSSALLLGPTPIHNIWSGFNGDCANGDGGDPVVLYDKSAQRWVVGQMNVKLNAYCMAVSTTSDATQSYYRYEFSFGSNTPDYPKLAVWPDAYYWTANTFSGPTTFVGANPCAFDRATMLSGGPANAICMQQNPSVDSRPRRNYAAADRGAQLLSSDGGAGQPEPLQVSRGFHDALELHLHGSHRDPGGALQRSLWRRHMHSPTWNDATARFPERPPDVPAGVSELWRP